MGSHQAQAQTPGDNPILGDLLVLLAQLSYASYIVLFKNFVGKYSLVTIMKWMFTYAFIFTLPFSSGDLMATDWQALGPQEIGALTFVVVGGTFFSYMLVLVGQKMLRPTVAGMYNYVQPVVSCAVAVAWGLDVFNMTKVFAVLMIFCGVYLVTASRSREEMVAHENEGRS